MRRGIGTYITDGRIEAILLISRLIAHGEIWTHSDRHVLPHPRNQTAVIPDVTVRQVTPALRQNLSLDGATAIGRIKSGLQAGDDMNAYLSKLAEGQPLPAMVLLLGKPDWGHAQVD